MAATGRQRAKTSKFWATAISRMDRNVATIVRRLDDLIYRSPELEPYMWVGSGYRSGSKEHGSGRAIDVIFTEDVGRKATAAEKRAARLFADFIIKNGKALGVQWVLLSIDDKVTWSYNMDRGSWSKLADRGSIPANHRDHVHVYFKQSARWRDSLNSVVVGSGAAKPNTPVVTPPTTNKWDGVTYPGAQIFKVRNTKTDATTTLQKRLKVHGYDPGPTDGYYGPKTIAATMAFQRAQGWRGADADGYPGPSTWGRLIADPTSKSKTIVQMAQEVIAGKHGIGHETRRKSLGVSDAVYQKVRAEVNKRVK